MWPIMHNFMVTKMLVDTGSILNLLTLKVLGTGVFLGVNGNIMRPLGKITLPVTFGDSENFCNEEIIFDITNTLLPYNSILGRPVLAKFMAISHFSYNMMIIPAAWGVIKVKADMDDTIYCVQKIGRASCRERVYVLV